jgi:hypothetical protein
MKASLKQLDRFAWIILALALILRIIVAQMVISEGRHMGDSLYYQTIASQPILFLWNKDAPVTSVAPLYPLLLIPFFQLIPNSQLLVQIQAVQIAQALLDTITLILIYRLVLRLFDQRVARVALVIQAFDLRYAFQASKLVTEVLYIFLMVGFMLIVLIATSEEKLKPYRQAGVWLGLAVLTRPVPLLFPAVLLIHAWFHPQDRRRALKGVAQLTGIMLLVVTPGVIRASFAGGGFVPLSDTFFSHLWLSSREDGRDIGGKVAEQAVMEETGSESIGTTSNKQYLDAALANILSAPWQWGKRVIGDTLRAYVQPYPTLLLIAPSDTGAREVIQNFFAGRASLGDVLTIPGLWRRLLMYIWHFGTLIGGTIGLVLAWREYKWQLLPLYGWVIYTTAATAAFLIEPRYIFPTMFVFTILTAYAAVRLYDMIRQSRRVAVTPAPETGDASHTS